jgi:hypothetical protein
MQIGVTGPVAQPANGLALLSLVPGALEILEAGPMSDSATGAQNC